MNMDVSEDYLLLDFLLTVDYFSATGGGTFTDGVPIGNCSFFGQMKDVAGDDLRRTYSALVIRQAEWSEQLAATPQRGDKFALSGVTYFVESVAGDPVRLKQWVLRSYAI